MRVLRLAGHYKRTVEIDMCAACSLIWFDAMESIRIAGPGLVALVHEIDACMAVAPTFRPLPQTLPCQVCGGPLKRAFNLTRYGRTVHLECPQEHGIYQSFMLFLAEKGYFRPYEWHDVHALSAAGKSIQCSQCGATLEARPQNACPYCASPVGVYDPARLAAAIDREQVAAPVSLPPKPAQVACEACGGMLDPSRDVACPQCRALVRPRESAMAVAVSSAVLDEVADNYQRQQPKVSRRKLEEGTAGMLEAAYAPPPSHGIGRRVGIIASCLCLGVLLWSGMGRQAKPIVVENEDGSERRLSASQYEAEAARERASRMRNVIHAPAGEPPPQLQASRDGEALQLAFSGGAPVSVGVNLAYEQLRDAWVRCPMEVQNRTGERKAMLDKTHGSATFVPSALCSKRLRDKGRYEYTVMSGSKTVFKSDSAFFD
ncbi:hypothetical protein [Niveibacterium sp.]|uniref:hypothetical protein n=1 Tax=Niveibacterium sp. TaxID=2017444 RepID=UPI0035B204C3